MRLAFFLFCLIILLHCTPVHAQDQGFFLDQWQPEVITAPSYTDVSQTNDPVTVSLKVLFHDTITKVPQYVFGDNANLWTGCMSNNAALMHHMASRRMGVLRGPGGSVSDVYFWNHSIDDPPADIPAQLAGQTEAFTPWYGIRPYPWESWTMSIDSFYSILNQTATTGMLTVNYGYARYGTSTNPVAAAAHMAADWVRYDHGRTKFWEIGNEVFGSWEAGYRIDPAQNHDGQPEYITATLYGQHCLVFIDSMKAAAASIGIDIKTGIVMLDAYSSSQANYNRDVAAIVGDVADFYIVHNYYTPYNQNSNLETILNSYRRTGDFKSYVYSELDKAGKPHRPVALTEYNIFAQGSNQAVSHANGMLAVMVTAEAIKKGYGAAIRWDLANGWDNGNDHGMFSSGDEPGVIQYAPRPAFYNLYYMRQFTGDVLLNSTQRGDTNVIAYPTAFSSGQVAVTLVNRGRSNEIARLNIQDFRFGSRYYVYTLTGEEGVDFSRKVSVNGVGTSLIAGGPLNYEDIPANSSLIGDEIRIKLPPLSSAFVLVEPGDKELTINEEVYGINDYGTYPDLCIYPNPAKDKIILRNIPAGISAVTISDGCGRIFFKLENLPEENDSISMNPGLTPGMYVIKLSGPDIAVSRKLIIEK